jgi:hypothetical protein
LHVHLGCAFDSVRHLEYFHDHVRIEQMLLGASAPLEGQLAIASARPGFGLELNVDRAAQYRIAHAELRAH